MRIDSLALTNFRNFTSTKIRPGKQANIFIGDNGSGKTNLLEAIFTLCLGRSQRRARDAMMVRENGENFFRLEGVGEVAGREVKLACAYEKGGRKKITVDDNPVRISRLFELFSIISMAPEDVNLFAGSPSGRRRFMDLHLSQSSPSYLSDLTDYSKALAQKNAFLKNHPGDECPFDSLLIDFGSRLMTARHGYIHFLQALAPGYYDQISGADLDPESSTFTCEYKPNVPFQTKEEIVAAFEAKLAAGRRKEEILESAVVGPHRDEIDFTINDFPARGYGSQGELRSAAVAIMMAAANFLESRRDEKPILLLDEIFAELDYHRREHLAGLFGGFEQIFLTTAIDPPKSINDRAVYFHITEGKVERD